MPSFTRLFSSAAHLRQGPGWLQAPASIADQGPIPRLTARLGLLLLALLVAATWFLGAPLVEVGAQDAGEGLPPARIEQLPTWHGGSSFTFELHFSENPGLSYTTVRDDLFEVDGGRIWRARRVTQGSNVAWEVHVAPDGFGEITIAGMEMTAVVPGPGDRLAARISGLPSGHDGAEFEARLDFNQSPGLSYVNVRDHVVAATGGTVQRARRVNQGDNSAWTLTIAPDGDGTVGIAVPITGACGDVGDVCMRDGTVLADGAWGTVRGPDRDTLERPADTVREIETQPVIRNVQPAQSAPVSGPSGQTGPTGQSSHLVRHVMDWDQQPAWTTGSTSSQTFNVGAGTVRVALSGDTDRLNVVGALPSPATSTQVDGGSGQTSLLLAPLFEQQGSGNAPQFVLVDIHFNYAGGVSNPSLTVYDVDQDYLTARFGDRGGDPRTVDRVISTARTGQCYGTGTTINPSTITFGTANTPASGNQVTGTAVALEDDPAGNAIFEYNGTGISCIQVWIQNVATLDDMQETILAIGDISFDAPDPGQLTFASQIGDLGFTRFDVISPRPQLPDVVPLAGTTVLGYELEGDLPLGMFYDSAARTLHGTPVNVTSRPATLTYRAFIGVPDRDAVERFAITVHPRPTLSAPSDMTFIQGAELPTNIEPLPAVVGGTPPHKYRATHLPPGMGFDPQTRRLTGTPESGGRWIVNYGVFDAHSVGASTTFRITVVPRWTLDWDELTWERSEDGSLNLSEAYVVGGGTVTFTISGETGDFVDTGDGASPALAMLHTGGLDPAEDGLLINKNLPTTGKTTLTIDFDHAAGDTPGVQDVRFALFDVDGVAAGVREQVKVTHTVEVDTTTTNSGQNLAVITTGDHNQAVSGSGDHTVAGTAVSDDATDGANVHFETGLDHTSQIVIELTNSGATAGEGGFTLSDLSFVAALQPLMVDDPEHLVLTIDEEITPVTFPEATGGGGEYLYRFQPALPPGLEFDPMTRVLSGTPTQLHPRTTHGYIANATDGSSAIGTFTITVRPPLRVLDWDLARYTWTRPGGGQPVLTRTYDVGGADVTFTISGNTSGFVNQSGIGRQSPATTKYFSGGLSPTENSLLIEKQLTAIGSRPTTTLTIDFAHTGGVSNVVLPFFDIAGEATGRRERVVATATAGGSTVNPSAITTGEANEQVGNNGVQGTENVASNVSDDGNATIRFGQSGITQIRLVLSNQGSTNATHGGYALHDISFFALDEPVVVDAPGDFEFTEDRPIDAVTFDVADGGDGSYTYQVTPALPTGLTFDPATRVLSGTPEDASEETRYTYRATDGEGARGTDTFNITVNATPSLVAPPSQFFEKDAAITAITLAEAENGTRPFTYELSSNLPDGLSFDAATRTLSGMPTALGTTTVTYTATDFWDAVATDTFDITVVEDFAEATLDWDLETWPAPVSGTPTLERTFDAGGGDVTVTIEDPYEVMETSDSSNLSPVISNRIHGGTSENALQLTGTFEHNTSDTVTAKIAFSHPNGVNGVTFSIFSVDLSGFANAPRTMDEVTVTATVDGSTVNPTWVQTGSKVDFDGTNTVTGNDSVFFHEATGNATFGFGYQGITEVQLVWDDIVTDATGNNRSRLALHDVSFSYVPDELTIEAPSDKTYTKDTAIPDLVFAEAEGGVGGYTYDLIGTLPAGLDFDPATRTLSGTPTETKFRTVYLYTVTDADGTQTDDDIHITVDETPNVAPSFSPATASRSVAENTAAETNIGAALPAATDNDGDHLTYSLGGPDAAFFDFDTVYRQLSVGASATLDHETKPSHTVTMIAEDPRGATGELAITITITDVDEPPTAPSAPTVSAVEGSSTSLSVSWTAPDNSGKPAITGYDVQYRQGTSGPYTAGPQDVTGTTATIASLAANTSYEVQVLATNADGDSDWSTATSGTTGNSVPVFTPATASRSVAENSGESTNVGAALPAATDADGDSLTYTLGGDDAASFTFDTTTRQLTVATGATLDHEAQSTYQVTVTADDGNGGTADLTVNITVTDAAEPPAAPAAPTVNAVANSTTSLSVSWTAPANTGKPAIESYDVRYRQGTSGTYSYGPQDVTGATGATIDSLTAGTFYEVQVRATNDEGDSDWSAAGSGTTNTPSNSAPVFTPATASRSVAENSSAGTTVGAALPAATDADTGDTLTYSLGGADSASFSLDTTTLQLTVAAGATLDHESKPSNTVTITATDGNASAVLTVTISITDVDEPPAAPTVNTVVGSTSTLSVSWTAPDNDGKPTITNYDVQYRQGTSGTYSDGPQDVTGATSATIGSLTANTTYQVRVRATNAEGNGPWSTPTSGTTTAAANSVPTVANPIPNQTARAGTAFSYTFPANTFNDADGDTLVYGADQPDNSALPTWLTFTEPTRTFSGTPHVGDVGTFMVRVSASDRTSGAVADTFQITVQGGEPGVVRHTLDWDYYQWPAPSGGSITSEQSYQVGGGTVTVSISDDNNRLPTSGVAASPVTSDRLHGRTYENALLLNPTFTQTGSQGTAERVVVEFQFDHPGGVSNVSFTVIDVDASESGSAATSRDWVVSTGTSTQTINPSTITTRLSNQLAHNSDTIVLGTSPAGAAQQRGNVTFEYDQEGITSIRITLRNHSTADTLTASDIAIHDLSFDAAPPRMIDWDTHTWTAPTNQPPTTAELEQTYTIANREVTAEFSGNTNRLLINTPVTDQELTGGTTNENGLRIGTWYQSSGGSITLALDLSSFDGVNDLSFTAWRIDVNDAGTTDVADLLTVTATAGESSLNPSSITTGSVNMEQNDNQVIGTGSTASKTSADGNAMFVFDQSGITELKINHAADGGQAILQFAIHDISFASHVALDAPDSDQQYTVGRPIDDLVLPEAAGGAGTYYYRTDFDNLPDGLDYDPDTRTISGTPTTSTTAPFTVSYGATDGITTATAQFTITVNAAPSVNAPADQTYTAGTEITALAFDAATGGTEPFTYELSANLPGGLTFDGTTRMLTGTPTTATSGAVTVTYTATDANDAPAIDTFDITVNAANAVPVFDPTTVTRSVAENSGAGTNVGAALPAATDADTGDTLTYTLGGKNAGSFAFNATTRQITVGTDVTLDHETKSTLTVTMSVADGNGGTAVLTVTINVNDVDEPPAAPGAPTVNRTTGSSTSLSVSWAAPSNTGKPAISGYDLQYRQGSSGAFTAGPQDVAGTTATITSLNAGTTYEVQVRATNDEGDGNWSPSGSGRTNRAPAFTPTTETRSVDENSASGSNVGTALPAATDADNDTLTYSLGGDDATSFAFNPTTRQLTVSTGVTLDHETKSSYSVTMTADDSNGGTADLTVTINIGDVDEPPDAPGAPTVTRTLGSSTSLTVNWTAPDNDGKPAISGYDLQYRQGSSGAFTAGPQDVAGTTATITSLNAGTTYEVQVRATNDEGDGNWSPSGSGRTNRAPAFTPTTETRSVDENSASGSIVGAALPTATDADTGDTLTYSLGGDDAASFELNGRQLTVSSTADLDFEAKSTYTVTVTADDSNGGTAVLAVTINVNDVDEPPAAPSAPTVNRTAGSSTSLTVSWTAPDNDGKPDITSYDVQYRQGSTGNWSDGPQDVAGTNATITSLTAGTTYEVQVRATNDEGDSTWSAAGSGATNSAPVFNPATATRSVAENSAAGTNVGAALPAATDADTGDTLTYTLGGTDASSFSFNATTRQLTVGTGADLDYEDKSSYSVTMTADDSNGGTAELTVTVNIGDADEPPAAPAAPTVNSVGGSRTSLSVSWTAPSNTGPAITSYDLQYREGSTGAYTNGPQDVTGTTATITSLTANTSYQVRVRATNDEGDGPWSTAGSGTSNANSPPVFDPATVTRSVAENSASGTNVGAALPAATDADTGDTLTYSLGGADAASFAFNETTRQLTVGTGTTLNYESNTRSYEVTMTAADGNGGTDDLTVTINVGDVDEPPDAPAAPTVNSVGGSRTSLSVSWTAPSNTGPAVESYDLQSRQGTSGAYTDGPQDVTGTTATITSLTANTSYQVRVRATNDEGDGAWSNPTSGTTNANSPPVFDPATATRSVAENSASGTNVGAVLPAATDADTGDTLTYSLGGADAASFAFNETTRQLTVGTSTTLDHETKSSYEVTMTVADGNGGTAVLTVTINIGDVDEPPAAPAAPTVTASAGSTTSLSVSWSAPANTGPTITSYDLQYRVGSTGNWSNGPEDVTGTTATIDSLTANTSYQVRVRATNDEGDGAWSNPTSGTTNGGGTANSAPRVANAIPDQTATAGTAFTYTFPANTFGDADSDTLTYEADQPDDSPLPTWLTFTGLTRTFSGTPQADDAGRLSVRVTASDGNGGSVSDTFTITVTGDSPIEENDSPVEGNGIVEGGIIFADGSSAADLPQGATIRVILADSSKVGVPYTVIKEQTCTIGAGTCSGVFELSYDMEDIDLRNEYVLVARITNEEGRLIYVNDTVHQVITSPHPFSTNSEDRDIEVVAVP